MRARAWYKLARVDAYFRQGRRCCFCRCSLTRDTATADHIKPQKFGRDDRPENIQAACRHCNTVRGHRTVGQFKRLLTDCDPAPLPILICRSRRAINTRADLACRRIAKSVGMTA